MGPAFGIADRGLSGNAARMPQGAEVSRGPNVAVDVGKQGCRSLKFVPGLGVRPDEHGSSPLRSNSRRCQPTASRRDLLFQDRPIHGRQALGSKGVILLNGWSMAPDIWSKVGI